jgi:RNA polymerase sigma factor (sigma-70 family)
LTLARAIVNKLRLPGGVSRDDAIQDAVVLILERRAVYNGSRLTRRVLGDLQDRYGAVWRRQYRFGPTVTVSETDIDGEAESDRVEAQDVQIDVREAIEKLTPKRRFVMYLLVVEEKSYAQIAEQTGTTVYNVKKLAASARQDLKRMLNAYR